MKSPGAGLGLGQGQLMNLPKDWSKKPNWLDKAKASGEDGGGFGVFLAVLALLLAIAGVGAFVFFMLAR